MECSFSNISSVLLGSLYKGTVFHWRHWRLLYPCNKQMARANFFCNRSPLFLSASHDPLPLASPAWMHPDRSTISGSIAVSPLFDSHWVTRPDFPDAYESYGLPNSTLRERLSSPLVIPIMALRSSLLLPCSFYSKLILNTFKIAIALPRTRLLSITPIIQYWWKVLCNFTLECCTFPTS